MNALAPFVIFLVLLVVVYVVTVPLRRARGADPTQADEERAGRREELEAAKQAKYREIRDAKLDFDTGKLSEADFRAVDRELRAEAAELLGRLDELDELDA